MTKKGAARRQVPKRRTVKHRRRQRTGKDGLTNRQRAWIEHYLICWNASEAARRCGFKSRANTAGHRMLSNVVIQGLIQQRFAEMTMTGNEVLARLTAHARGNLVPFLAPDGESLEITSDAAKQNLMNVKRYKVTHGVTKSGEPWTSTEIELYDAQAALVHIGRHYNLFGDCSVLFNLDLSKLTDEQIDRIADGENPLHVLADSSAGRTGAAPAPAEKPAP